jgi:hypothetical protein
VLTIKGITHTNSLDFEVKAGRGEEKEVRKVKEDKSK